MRRIMLVVLALALVAPALAFGGRDARHPRLFWLSQQERTELRQKMKEATPQERTEMKKQLCEEGKKRWDALTPEEREQIQAQHREGMRDRMRERWGATAPGDQGRMMCTCPGCMRGGRGMACMRSCCMRGGRGMMGRPGPGPCREPKEYTSTLSEEQRAQIKEEISKLSPEERREYMHVIREMLKDAEGNRRGDKPAEGCMPGGMKGGPEGGMPGGPEGGMKGGTPSGPEGPAPSGPEAPPMPGGMEGSSM